MELAINGRGRLDELELVINKNMRAFYEIGTALKEIRDSRLYKDVLGYDTFEDYCRERWDFGRHYANYQIGATQVLENLQDGNHGYQTFPTSERQARPLTRLSPPLQIEAWTKVIDTAPDGKVTAVHVSRVVCEFVEDGMKKRINKIKRAIKDEFRMSEKIRKVFNEFLGVVQAERSERWENTSREMVIEIMESIIITIKQEQKGG